MFESAIAGEAEDREKIARRFYRGVLRTVREREMGRMRKSEEERGMQEREREREREESVMFGEVCESAR